MGVASNIESTPIPDHSSKKFTIDHCAVFESKTLLIYRVEHRVAVDAGSELRVRAKTANAGGESAYSDEAIGATVEEGWFSI